MASRFDLWGTFTRLRQWYGLRVGRNYGIRYLKAALYGHLPEIKEYILATKKRDLDQYFDDFDENIQWLKNLRDNKVDGADANANLKERLEAASHVGRDTGKMIAVFTEAESKKKAEADFDDTKNAVLTAIQEVKEEIQNKSE